MDPANTHVAVIGVGTGGVSALRWCKARGFPVMGFEKEAGCGGIWRWGSAHSPAYDSLYTNSSGIMMSLGDFSRRFQGKFPHHKETCEYYEEYMNLYKLKEHVRWRTIVERVYKEEERWAIEYRGVGEDPTTPPKIDFFDRVIVAAGRLWDPSYPPWANALFGKKSPPIANINGMEVMHSREYRNPSRFAGKRVVVVGLGNSALDISLELSADPHVLKPILVSCRRGAVVMPIDDPRGDPADVPITSRAFQNLISAKARGKMLTDNVDHVNKEMRKLGLPPPPNPDNYFALENPIHNLKNSLGYVAALKKGLIKFVGGVTGFADDARTLPISNGLKLSDVDAVILCTGYRVGMDFLDPAVRSKVVKTATQKNGVKAEYVDLHKQILYPYDPTIAFLVLVTSYGNESVVGAMQARWATKFWADPEFAQKNFSLAQFEKESAKRFKSVVNSCSPSPLFVRYLMYMDDLAADLQCLPDIGAFMKNPLDWPLAFKLLFGPAMAPQYFLNGPDSMPQQVKEFYAKL